MFISVWLSSPMGCCAEFEAAQTTVSYTPAVDRRSILVAPYSSVPLLLSVTFELLMDA